MTAQPAVLQVVILRDGLLVGTEVFVPGSYTVGSGPEAEVKLDDASVDVVISNCVINLSPDKPAVLAEAFRVLVPGGRVRVAERLSPEAVGAAMHAAIGALMAERAR